MNQTAAPPETLKSTVRKLSVLFLSLTVILTIRGINILLTPDPSYDDELFSYLVLSGITLLAGLLVLFFVKLRLAVRSSLPVYWTVILLPVFALLKELLLGNSYYLNLRWLRLGPVSVYLPALFSLLILPLAYLVIRYQKITAANGCWLFLLCGVIPFFLAWQIRGIGSMVPILVTFLFFVIRLRQEKKLTQDAWLAFILTAGASILMFIWYLLGSPAFMDRVQVFLSQGEIDRYGQGYPLVLLTENLGDIRLLGSAGPLLYADFSAAEFFSRNGYPLLTTALNLGWAAMGLLLISLLTLSGTLLAMSRRASNPFARHVIFCCAVFFLMRTILAVSYEFTLLNAWEAPPFLSNRFTFFVDGLLLFLSLTLYLEKAPKSVADDCIPHKLAANGSSAYDSPVDRLVRTVKRLIAPLKSQLGLSFIELTGPDGRTQEYELLDTIEYQGKSYVFLAVTDALADLDDPDEISILELMDDPDDPDEESYISVGDLGTEQALFDIFLYRAGKRFKGRTFVLAGRKAPPQKSVFEPEKEADPTRKNTVHGFSLRPYSGTDSYIFVSYSHRDRREVMNIVRRMQLDGYRVWYDEGIDPGTEYNDNIATHILQSGYFISFLSQNYLDSEYCKDEANYARKYGKRILRIYLEDVTLPPGMEMRMDRSQAIHRYTYSDPDDFWDKLYRAFGIQTFRTRH